MLSIDIITSADLQDYIDDFAAPEGVKYFDQLVADDERAAAMVETARRHNCILKEMFDPIAREAIPPNLLKILSVPA